MFPELEINQSEKEIQSIPIDYKQFKPSNKRLRNLFSIPILDFSLGKLNPSYSNKGLSNL